MRFFTDDAITETKEIASRLYAKLAAYRPDDKLGRDDIRSLMFIVNDYNYELAHIQHEREKSAEKAASLEDANYVLACEKDSILAQLDSARAELAAAQEKIDQMLTEFDLDTLAALQNIVLKKLTESFDAVKDAEADILKHADEAEGPAFQEAIARRRKAQANITNYDELNSRIIAFGEAHYSEE